MGIKIIDGYSNTRKNAIKTPRYINTLYTLEDHEIEQGEGFFKINLKAKAETGELPNKLCLFINTDAQITNISSKLGLIQVVKGGKGFCTSKPPREVNPVITLNSKPTIFELNWVSE